MTRYYCTYFDRNYLCKALAMIDSLVRHESAKVKVFAVCMDEFTRIILTRLNLPCIVPVPMHTIEAGDLALLKTKRERTTVEYYWTATPTIVLRLMENNPEIDFLTYLDADLFFFSSPQPIYNELGNGSVLIHEHRYSPELAFLAEDNGRFNVGLVSFRSDIHGLEVLRWWRERCIEWCFLRNEDGKMGDQMYLNDWPERFSGVVVLKSHGAGVAPWNHGRYRFDADNSGNVCVDDQLLIFYHFHSFSYVSTDCFRPHHAHYGFPTEALGLCFVPYLQALASWFEQVNAISSGFCFGIDKPADLETESLVAVARKDRGDHTATSTFMDQWALVSLEAHQELQAEFRASHAPTAGAAFPKERLWPEGKPVASPDDLLLTLRGRHICNDIRNLYIIGAFEFEEEALLNGLFPYLEKIVLIEPIPKLAKRLSERFAHRDEVVVLPYAVADVDGRATFNVTNNGQSSSLLPMGLHLEIFPDVRTTQAIDVDCRRLETIIDKHRLPLPDMLFIDAQGAELRILQAISRDLRRAIKLVYSEASTRELYVGSGTLADIRAELAETFIFGGYAPTRNEIPIHGNALFVSDEVVDRIAKEDSFVANSIAGDAAPMCDDGQRFVDSGLQKSLVDANRRFSLNPGDPDAAASLGHVLAQAGSMQEAAVFLRLALKMDGAHVRAGALLSDLAGRLIDAGELHLGRDCCLTLLSLAPDNQGILDQWARLKDSAEAKQIVDIRRCAAKDYRVAAIVSTYKSEAFIDACLSNLQNQANAEQIEIIVLDAASPENEKRVVTEYQKKYGNITYIRTRERIGVYTAWNMAIANATAPYCISVSTNDQLRPDACEMLARELDADPDAMLVFGDTFLTHHPHETFEVNRHYASYRWPAYSFERHLDEGCCIGPHPMWRRSIHKEISHFDERFIADGDQEFWLRIGSRYSIRHIDAYTGLQWITPESLSGKGDTPLLEVDYIKAKYRHCRKLQRQGKGERSCFRSHGDACNPQLAAIQ